MSELSICNINTSTYEHKVFWGLDADLTCSGCSLRVITRSIIMLAGALALPGLQQNTTVVMSSSSTLQARFQSVRTVQGELQGRLDVVTAQAQIARWELADAQARIRALEVEARAKRETLAAAQRRAKEAENKLILKEQQVCCASAYHASKTQ